MYSNTASALTDSSFALTFRKNAGTAKNVFINAVSHNAGDATAELSLNVSGTPSGTETIEIKPSHESSIYDQAGNPMNVSSATGEIALLGVKSPPRVIGLKINPR